jgi:hypothetical protein
MDCYLVSLLTLGCCAEASCEEEKFAACGEEELKERDEDDGIRPRDFRRGPISIQIPFSFVSLANRWCISSMDPYSYPCMTLGYLGEATRRFRVRFPGGDKCRHVCLQRIKSENFCVTFITNLLSYYSFLLPFFFLLPLGENTNKDFWKMEKLLPLIFKQ